MIFFLRENDMSVKTFKMNKHSDIHIQMIEVVLNTIKNESESFMGVVNVGIGKRQCKTVPALPVWR